MHFLLKSGCPGQLGNYFGQRNSNFYHVQIISDNKDAFKNDFGFLIIFFNIFTYFWPFLHIGVEEKKVIKSCSGVLLGLFLLHLVEKRLLAI